MGAWALLLAFKVEPQSCACSLRQCSDERDPSPAVSYPLDSVVTEARTTGFLWRPLRFIELWARASPRGQRQVFAPRSLVCTGGRGKELREQAPWKKGFSFIPLTLEKNFLYSNELKKIFFPYNFRFSSPFNRNLEAKLCFDISQHWTANSWNPLTGLVQCDCVGLVFPVSLFNSYNPAVWVVSPHFIHEECKAQRGSETCLRPLSWQWPIQCSDADLSHVKVHFKWMTCMWIISQYNF